MAQTQDLARIVEQEGTLIYDDFGEAQAYRLGTLIHQMARERRLAVVIDIRFWDRPLFFAALPGSTGANAEWARRKINSVRLYHKSSYRLFLEMGARERIFRPDFGHSSADFAIAGGAFPLRVRKVGVVGAVAVSGLPQREDHALVVTALGACLGMDGARAASPPANA